MLYLSKSKYCRAVQCPKMLWLSEHNPEAFDGAAVDQAVLDRGNEVGDLAMGLFGDYSEVPFDSPAEMIRTTRALLDAGAPVITEASFAYEGLFCSVDILLNYGENRVGFVEVKSGTKVRDMYAHDVAYQYYVLTGLGFAVEKAGLAHLNGGYVRRGALDLKELFMVEDMTERARQMRPEVEQRVRALEAQMALEGGPERGIGAHCFEPYACGFFGYCTRDLPKPNIFDVGGIQLRTKLANYEKGIVSFEDIERKKALKPDKMLQVSHELHDLPPAIDRAAVGAFLSALSYPLYFLDFESFQPAVPLYDGTSPYEQIVFQYSLHRVEAEGAAVEHTEYLAEPGGDPRRGVAERLCRDIPKGACTLVYNMAFEKARLRGFAGLYPDLAGHLMDIHDGIADLMAPFRQRKVYVRAMRGSYSVKAVLPALFPDDPELDYHSLEGVHNGEEASAAFERMGDMGEAERRACRESLLKYCGLDTLAMVRIWEKLREAAAGA